jgi:hypothetical protein
MLWYNLEKEMIANGLTETDYAERVLWIFYIVKICEKPGRPESLDEYCVPIFDWQKEAYNIAA